MDIVRLNRFAQVPIPLQNLDFVFAPVMSGTASLSSGEIINGTAGQVNITGDGNQFIQGTSSSDATSSGSDGRAAADAAAKKASDEAAALKAA